MLIGFEGMHFEISILDWGGGLAGSSGPGRVTPSYYITPGRKAFRLKKSVEIIGHVPAKVSIQVDCFSFHVFTLVFLLSSS